MKRAESGRARWVAGLLVALSMAPLALAQGGLDERELELLGVPAGQALSGSELAAATEAVAGLMRCPVCQGLSVADSHTDSAIAMKAKAETLLAAGYSTDQVLSYFESSYGEFIRLSPRPEGFNLLVWLLPAAGLLVGILLIWLRLRRRPEAGLAASPAPTAAADDDDLAAYRERVRREVGG